MIFHKGFVTLPLEYLEVSNISSIKLLTTSSLVVALSTCIGLLTYPITKTFFGTMGIDTFIIIFYCTYLYTKEYDTGKFIFSTNFIHCVMLLLFRASLITGFCIVVSQTVSLIALLVIGTCLKRFNIKQFNQKNTLEQHSLLAFITLMICCTTTTILFAIISYVWFGLLRWIYIGTLITAPLSALVTVATMVLWYKYVQQVYPNMIRKLFFK